MRWISGERKYIVIFICLRRAEEGYCPSYLIPVLPVAFVT